MRPSCLRLQFATKTPSQRSVRFNDEETRIFHFIPDKNMVYDEYESNYQTLVTKAITTKLSSTVNTEEVFHCNHNKNRTFWDDDEDGIYDDGESLDGDAEEMSSRSDDNLFYNEDRDFTSRSCSARTDDHSYHHKRRKLNHQMNSCRIRDELDDTRHRR